MKTRREFIKTSVAVAVGAAVAGPSMALAGTGASGYPGGIIYTAKAQGKWEGKAGSHSPRVEVKGSRVTVKTVHGMKPAHYIVRHTIVTSKGKVVGENTFSYDAKEASSTFTLPDGVKGKLYATSFCNKHDFWVSEFTV